MDYNFVPERVARESKPNKSLHETNTVNENKIEKLEINQNNQNQREHTKSVVGNLTRINVNSRENVRLDDRLANSPIKPEFASPKK